jgi:hypothetical protein
MHAQLDPLLAAQLGLVTRLQAWNAGVSGRQVDALLARNLLIPVYRGVFRDPAVVSSDDQIALAAVLACVPNAVVSHRLAVAQWGMRNFQCALKEVTSPGLRRVPGIVSHRSIRPPDQTVLRGVPITTPARTILDVSTVVGARLVGRWIATWTSTGVLSLDDLQAQMESVKGHAGPPTVREALSGLTIVPGADSPAEALLGLVLTESGLPPLTLHHVVTLASGLVFELDWSYPEWRIALEMDGYGVHLRSLDAFEHDRFRRNELEIEGWTIMNFTKRQVERQPKSVVGQVRRLLEGRSLISSPGVG